MGLTVKFRTASEELTTRQFPLRTGISVYGKATGIAGLGEPGTNVRMEIPQMAVFQEQLTNVFGDYAFHFLTPSVNANLTIVITATYSVTGQDVVRVPVGVGNVTPEEVPPPPSNAGFGDLLQYALWGLGLYAAIKIVPLLINNKQRS